MYKYKLTKEIIGTKVIWHYRDFKIKNIFPNHTYPKWVVKLDGSEVYSNGNGTRKEMMNWIDNYYMKAWG